MSCPPAPPHLTAGGAHLDASLHHHLNVNVQHHLNVNVQQHLDASVHQLDASLQHHLDASVYHLDASSKYHLNATIHHMGTNLDAEIVKQEPGQGAGQKEQHWVKCEEHSCVYVTMRTCPFRLPVSAPIILHNIVHIQLYHVCFYNTVLCVVCQSLHTPFCTV